MTNVQEAPAKIRQVLECVREAPLSPGRNSYELRSLYVRSKAPSPLRFAGALQDAGAFIEMPGVGFGHWDFFGHWSLVIGHSGLGHSHSGAPPLNGVNK